MLTKRTNLVYDRMDMWCHVKDSRRFHPELIPKNASRVSRCYGLRPIKLTNIAEWKQIIHYNDIL